MFWHEKCVAGQINYTTGEILVKDILRGKEMESTFFHEIAHGILKELEFNYPNVHILRNNEEFTHELGLNLRQIFLQLLDEQRKWRQK
jgi:hypothetical protein